MGPTEVEKTPYAILEETAMVCKNDEEILDFDMCCGPQQETGFSEISGECIADLDSDEELMNLFILAVIFTRGNPFDSRKHWRMRCDFLETNLKIRCLEKIREVDESAENVPTRLFPKKTPVVRLVHVQPRELIVDCETEEHDDGKTGFVANEVCPDECGCNVKNHSCADDSENTSLIKLDGKKATNVTFQNTQTDIMDHRGHERFVDEDDFENVDSARETKRPLFGCSHPETLPRTTFENDHWLLPEPVQNEFLDKNTALGPAAETKSRPGFFTKATRRFLNFFRKNKVGVLPPSADGPATHGIST